MNTKRNTLLIALIFFLSSSSWAQSLVINEFMADNDTLTNITDEVGQYDDWIELHNLTNASLDLTGYYLSDKLDNLTKWPVPNGTSINANGYLIFWADNDASQGPLHTNFKLSKAGESFYLTNSMGAIVDSVNYGEQLSSISSARIPNGTGDFVFHAPTFNYNNEATSSISTIANDAAFSIYPNPATDFCTLTWTETNHKMTLDIAIWDVTGKILFSDQLTPGGNNTVLKIPVQQFTSGTYFLQLNTEEYHAVKVLVIE